MHCSSGFRGQRQSRGAGSQSRNTRFGDFFGYAARTGESLTQDGGAIIDLARSRGVMCLRLCPVQSGVRAFSIANSLSVNFRILPDAVSGKALVTNQSLGVF